MTPLAYRVLQALASGAFRSGEALARQLGISRGSIWHAVRVLDRMGLTIYRVRGRGYRLRAALSLLDAARIERELQAQGRNVALEVFPVTDSTNRLALERARQGESGRVIAAEWQSAGRGRLGRSWHAPVAGALTFSLVWRFEQGAAGLSGLSLAVGVALLRALRRLGADARLKWPNDVVWRGSKLAGVLVEMQGDALGPASAVIGVGVNVRLSDDDRRHIDQSAADLESICGHRVDRNGAFVAILLELLSMLERFERDGFAPLCAEWQRHHAWQGREVRITLPDGRVEGGVARGVDEDGALLVAAKGDVRRYHSGEVSLRLKTREPVSMEGGA